MKKLLNVLFITIEDSYLSLENENIIIKHKDDILLRVPLLNLEQIVIFNYFGASPALMSECAKRNITLSFLNEYGKYLGTLYGETKGNVLLRKEQYRISEDKKDNLQLAKSFIFGKLHNQKWVIERGIRDHAAKIDEEKLKSASSQISENLNQVFSCENIDILRAVEGNAAQAYFKAFDELILQNKNNFYLLNRNRRPPTDPMNAMLSLSYTLLAADCRHALESVGLDSYVGFMHRDRPGRASLALDLMEELRPHFSDRFVLSLINRKEIAPDDFEFQETGAVLLKSEAKKKFLAAWQQRKKDMITHPFLEDKIEWGLVPYVQALLLARCLRKDLDSYPPFLWK